MRFVARPKEVMKPHQKTGECAKSGKARNGTCEGDGGWPGRLVVDWCWTGGGLVAVQGRRRGGYSSLAWVTLRVMMAVVVLDSMFNAVQSNK
jgi:hypothetical protein